MNPSAAVGDAVRFTEGDRLGTGEYRELRSAAGWAEPGLAEDALDRALAVSWNVTARVDSGRLIGMGRLHDDGLYASIWDMIVRPECRRRGVGGEIFTRLMHRCQGRSLVVLVATAQGAPMYRARGFAEQSRGSTALFRRG